MARQPALRAPGRGKRGSGRGSVVRADIHTAPVELAKGLVLHRVVDDATLSCIHAAVREMANDTSPARRYPGPNPVSLDTSRYGSLAAQPYYVCEKTDGVRYALVCCTVAGRNLVALVDRALAAYLLPLAHVPRAMFQGTLMDGEVAFNRASQRWDYVVFDAVVVSGVPVLEGPLTSRMEGVHRAMKVYREDAKDPLALRVKNFYRTVAEFETHLPEVRARYDIDGVILTPAAPPVVYGRHMDMFKVKFGGRHTVDFLVGADGVSLCVFDAGAHVAVAALGQPAAPGSIAECELRGDRWAVVGVRTDKATANDMFTYKRTLLNIRENLGIEDVKRVLG